MLLREILEHVDTGKLKRTLLIQWMGVVPGHLMVLGEALIHVLPPTTEISLKNKTFHARLPNRIVVVSPDLEKAQFMDEHGYRWADFEVTREFD